MSHISIAAIIPVYNVEEYLEECLASVCNQKSKFDEIIIINDGSTDESYKICEKYEAMYHEITIICQNNQGLSAARNVGMQHASAEYIVFIDSDDYVMDDLAEKIRNELTQNPVEVLYFSSDLTFEEGMKREPNKYLRSSAVCNYEMKGREFLEKSFYTSYIVSAVLAVYRREFLVNNHITFENGVFFEDNLFFFKVATAAEKIWSFSDMLYMRRVRNNSIMTGHASLKKRQDIVHVQIEMWEYLFRNLADKLSKRFIMDFVAFGITTAFLYLNIDEEETVSEEEYLLVNSFLKLWNNLYIEEITWNASLAWYWIWKRIKECSDAYKEEIRTYFKSTEEFLLFYGRLSRNIIERIRSKLERLPFKEGIVAIYGIGKHTDVLLSLYERYVGKIQSSIYFVISQTDNITYRNEKVYSYYQIKTETKAVIISSYLYKKEMTDNLKEVNISDDKIISIYDEEDIFDLVLLDKIMKE